MKDFLKEGEFFGHEEIIFGLKTPYRTIAEQDSWVYSITGDQFFEIFSKPDDIYEFKLFISKQKAFNEQIFRKELREVKRFNDLVETTLVKELIECRNKVNPPNISRLSFNLGAENNNQ